LVIADMQAAKRKSGIESRQTLVLEEAFSSFTRASQSLEQTYRSLEERIARLTAELAAANDQRAQQAAENARLCERLTLLLEALPGGVLVIDAGGTIVQANGVAAGLIGAASVGLPWDAVAARAFAQQDGADVVLRDGRRLTQSQRDLPDRSGRILLLTDDTESRAIRELLDRHRRLSAMGEMAAKLAHQIRTPLSAALLYASQLTAPAITAADRQRFAERAVARLKDLDRTVQEMLTFARGGPQPAEHVRIGAVLTEVLQVLEPDLGTGGMVLQVVCDADAAELTGSRTALAGALANLVTNARQAMNGQGVVLLEAHPAGDGWVDIRVSDSGPGIPPHHRERLFEPFFTTRQGGTGLGLAIVKSVVDAHHGVIAAEESTLGGACFSIRLPLSTRGKTAMLPGRVDD